jgi:hypothetical protein
MAREEILVGPLDIYLAPRGEAFPDLGAEPGSGWENLAQSGIENQDEDGVVVSLPQTIEEFIGGGNTMAIKAWRTEESVEVQVTVCDLRAETLALALNDNDVTEDTGSREVSLFRGIEVAEFALLARGHSPYEDDGDGQFQVPACYTSGEPEINYNKGEPSSIEFNFRSLLPEGDEMDDFKVIYSDPGPS